MAIFKILKGDSSRIDTKTTPYNEGYAYFTPDDGGFYIDAEVSGSQKRIRINENINDQIPKYTKGTSLTELTAGEKLSAAFGKIAKAISDLISHIGNKNNPHTVTASQIGALTSVPVADSNTLGGVKVGKTLSISDGILNSYVKDATTNKNYTLSIDNGVIFLDDGEG